MSPAADSLGGNGSALTFNASETPRRFAILFWKPSKARAPQSSIVKTQNRLPVETLLDQRLHSHERRRQTLPEVLEIGSVTRRHLSPDHESTESSWSSACFARSIPSTSIPASFGRRPARISIASA